MDAAVINVEVAPGEEGETLHVRWETTAPVAVDIAIGATPEAIDHAHARTEPAGTNEAVLGVSLAPTFVSVAPHGAGPAVVAGERRLRFAAMQNFRDLGGYRTAGGGRTRWGRLFRADSLHKLTDADREAFDLLGLRVVVDLRGDRERARHPNPITHAMQIAVTGRPVSADEAAEDEHAARERERRALAGADGERILRDLYVGMLEHSSGHFHQFYDALLAPNGLPAVFHCHAGKDRTGVIAALTLLALGVPADDVLDDYEMTRRYWRAESQGDSFDNLVSLGLSPEAAAGVLGAPRWAMEDTLHTLETTYGGVERYLTATVGLTPAQLDTLRVNLVA